EGLRLHRLAAVRRPRQLDLDGLLHDVRRGDHEDDQQHQADVDQRRDVDAGDRLVAVLDGGHQRRPSPAASPAAIELRSAFARPIDARRRRWKKLNARTAGIATNSPTAVATSASLMPAITTCAPPFPADDRSAKARMMPSTVPKRPMNGALLPSVPRMSTRCPSSTRLGSPPAAAACAPASRPPGAVFCAVRTTSSSRLLPGASFAAASRLPTCASRISSENRPPMRRPRKYAARSSTIATLSTLRPVRSQSTQPAPSNVKPSNFVESISASSCDGEHRRTAEVSPPQKRMPAKAPGHSFIW